METKKEEIGDLKERYTKRIEAELGIKSGDARAIKEEKRLASREYNEFREEFMPAHLSLYEKLCNFSEKVLKVKPDKKKEARLTSAIDICHLNITPTGAISFSLLIPIAIIFFGSLISYAIFASTFFIFFFFIVGLSLIFPFSKMPEYIANSWRLKASNQMVLCVFYVVTYMRHTSNLELAIEFAAEHLSPPLSLDLRKVLWNVETEEYESVKESLEFYLETWKEYNIEFIESFHLIEASLYEGSEERRLNSIDKALDVILSETYEKMMHYAHNLKSPITMLHMIGVILPILGLVILPLVVSFMEGVKWYHIATLYNVALPIAVYYLGKNILSTRPTGYGDTDISENPELQKYRNVLIKIGKSEIKLNPVWVAMVFFLICLFVGISPMIMHAVGIPDFGVGRDDASTECGKQFCMLEYREEAGKMIGPFGIGASILSLAVVIGMGMGLGLYYNLRSKNVIQIRNRAKQLEQEFASALFQLGNRLGDGIPAEMACGKVADSMEGTVSGNFFSLVSSNIKRLGMSVQQAIFDPVHGALVYFPSNLIEGSMKVLIEGVKKGPEVAAQALMNVSRYIKEIHKVNERLKDLMADISSSMTSQIKFLTPAIAGIVVGITSMVTNIIGKLSHQIAEFSNTGEAGGGLGAIGTMFKSSIPTYYFQVIVGIYVIQVVYILTIMANGIQNGADALNERFELGKNLTKSTVLYCFIAFVIMMIFNFIASSIMGATLGME